MFLENKKIKIELNFANLRSYQKYFEHILQKGDVIEVEQRLIPKTSRLEVDCVCDRCEKEFKRVRKDVGKKTLCSKECRNDNLKESNPNPKVEKIKVECNSCKKITDVFPSVFKKQEYFLCSRNCYKKHRSEVYCGANVYNFQDIRIECDNETCSEKFKISEFDKSNRRHHFCKKECYWEFKSRNYREFYYVENLFVKKETKPEKLTREWLENKGIEYSDQHPIKNYFADFYLPQENAIIEVYGDYWHCNPDFYGEEENKRKIHKNQQGVWKKDSNRVKDIESLGYKVYIIWENDVYNNLDQKMNEFWSEIKHNKKP